VLVLSGPLRARVTLLHGHATIAAKTAKLRKGRRTVLLVARKRSPAGRYLLRVVLSDGHGHTRTLTARVNVR
jgi:hypothetical protein